MRKSIFLLWIFLLFPSITWAQQKVEVPVWNVGDKWVFTQGNIEVVDSDQNSYTLNFSKDTCRVENKGLEKIILDKSTLNRTNTIIDGKPEKYLFPHQKIFNFPYNLGKEWKDTSTSTPSGGPHKGSPIDYSETFKAVGWENVKVQAGNFKALKLKYDMKRSMEKRSIHSGEAFYWYSPEVKYFVKCQYGLGTFQGETGWELVSFELKK